MGSLTLGGEDLLEAESFLMEALSQSGVDLYTRAMIERDLREDLSGTNPRRIDGELFFTHRTAIIVTRKLKPSSA